MFVALLDLGSLGGGDLYMRKAYEQIIIATAVNHHKINYVHISHFDADHYNAFRGLQKYYQQRTFKTITIDRLVCGSAGAHDLNKIKKYLKCFKDYELDEDDIEFHFDNGEYRKRNPYKNVKFMTPNVNIKLDGGYYFRINTLLYHAHNYPHYARRAGADKSVLINSGSSVILVAITEGDDPWFSYLFTGDATKLTYDILNTDCDFIFDTEPKLLSISHHGANRHVADDDDNTFTTLRALLDNFDPYAAVVSAKCVNKKGWTHPHINTVNLYKEKVRVLEPAAHNITAFDYNTARNKMIVKQTTLRKQLFATFELNPTAVVSDTDYDTINRSSNLFIGYDVLALFEDSDVGTDSFLVTRLKRV